MKTTYTAITIGPIYKTFSQGQRTRMIWGASYLFSFILRELVKILSAGKFVGGEVPDCKIDGEFLIPSIENIFIQESKYGAGKYPDRFIFQSEEGDFEKVECAIDKLLEYLSIEITKHISETKQYPEKFEIQEVKLFLEKYFQFYYFEKEIEDGENIALPLYNILDSLELKNKFIAEINENNYLQKYLFRVNKKKDGLYSFLVPEAFSDEEQVKRFKSTKRFDSLIEISTRGLARLSADAENIYKGFINEYIEEPQIEDKPKIVDEIKSIDDNQNEFIKKLKEIFKDNYKKYHNYVAVIYADGDKIGATLKKIGNNSEQLKEFSKKLLDFNTAAEETVFNYGGSPIYIGGDDIFAFVPIACLSETETKLKTIFDLVAQLDEKFEVYFSKDYAKQLNVIQPTLSFGISIAYFKFPLFENMQTAHKLLINAKNEIKNKDKNAISLMLQEHSGNIFEINIQKGNKASYQLIQNLITDLTSDIHNETFGKQWINSVIHKFKDETFIVLLKSAMNAINNDELLKNLFDKSFRDKIHTDSNGLGKDFLIKLRELILQTTIDNPSNEDENIKTIYSILRFIDFLNKKHSE